jgi:hypothetical protein
MKARGIVTLLGLLLVAGGLAAYVAADRAPDAPPAEAAQGQASPGSGEATEPDCGADVAQEDGSSSGLQQQGAKSETERASKEAKPDGPSADDPLGGMAPCAGDERPDDE